MYQHHPLFGQPADETVKVWKYMDFTKLVSLIDSKCLYFARADRFDDGFEGSWPRMNVEARTKVAPKTLPSARHALYLETDASEGWANREWVKAIALNCWHMNEHESAAMWKLYLNSNEGVAVQSRYNKLKQAIVEEDFYLGIVRYIDYESEQIEETGNLLAPFVHKRKSFEHEREVRAVIAKPPTEISPMIFSEHIKDGLSVEVDLETLIERIYVAPSSPDWFARLVDAVVCRYDYAFEVVHSKLDEEPLF